MTLWVTFTAMRTSSLQLLLLQNGGGGCYTNRQRRILYFGDPENGVGINVRERIGHEVWKKDEPSWQHWDDESLPLFWRAWAFQERLLARRIVHYTRQEIVWECQSDSWCECQCLDNDHELNGRFPRSTKFKTKYAEVIKHGSIQDRFLLWLSIIDQYQSRRITNPGDRLPALSAIAKQISAKSDMGRYIEGMWEHWFMKSLLWWSDLDSKRVANHHETHWRPTPSAAATWSWISVEGPVTTWGRFTDWGRERRSANDCWLLGILENDFDPSPTTKISVIAELTEIKIRRASDSRLCIVQANQSARTGKFFPDTNPFEISEDLLAEKSFYALKHSLCQPTSYNCLVLAMHVDGGRTHSQYRRLGIAEVGLDWFSNENRDRQFPILV